MHAPLRLWLRFIGVEFWLVALVPFQIGFIVGAQAWSSRAGLLGLATVALLTASSFVLNHLCDLETDRRNPRKAFSLLVRGDLTLAAGWALFGALQVATLALAALAGRDFLLCLLGLTAISLAYNIAPLRLKERPGLDIAANGASLGFLWFNCHPANVIMGDTGSLALGGSLGIMAVLIHQPFVLVIAGGIFVLEALSVILQTGWFKWTRFRTGEGRRIFLMAPIHHHFQKKGWHENQVVMRFYILSILFAVLALATLKLR